MVDRVMIGQITQESGEYGLRVSKPGFNVSTTTANNMLFDTYAGRNAMVYAGGAGLNLGDSSDNFLTTGGKSSLGYIPLVIVTEKLAGSYEAGEEVEGNDFFLSRIDAYSFTESTIQPVTGATSGWSHVSGQQHAEGATPAPGRNYDHTTSANEDAANVSYFVLRIPCAFGYMNSTYFS